MSTHSLTTFYEGGVPLVSMYGHWDGGVNSYGKRLTDFLRPLVLVNGIGAEGKNVANGMGCLAAQVIAHFKTEAGGFYISPTVNEDPTDKYVYQVYEKNGKICLSVETKGVKQFLLNDSVGNNGHVSKVVTFLYNNDNGTQTRRMLEVLRESEDKLFGNDLDKDDYRCFSKKKIVGKVVLVS